MALTQGSKITASDINALKARVKAEKATTVDCRILFVTEKDTTTNQHFKTEVSLEPGIWATLLPAMTLRYVTFSIWILPTFNLKNGS